MCAKLFTLFEPQQYLVFSSVFRKTYEEKDISPKSLKTKSIFGYSLKKALKIAIIDKLFS
jgi:hypothetical protein